MLYTMEHYYALYYPNVTHSLEINEETFSNAKSLMAAPIAMEDLDFLISTIGIH